MPACRCYHSWASSVSLVMLALAFHCLGQTKEFVDSRVRDKSRLEFRLWISFCSRVSVDFFTLSIWFSLFLVPTLVDLIVRV